MTSMAFGRRELMHGGGALAALGAIGLLASGNNAADAAEASNPAYETLLTRYATAVNAHDTSTFPQLFTEAYIQHSGRSPSGLAAQIANYQRIFENWPDFQTHIDDLIIGGDKIVAPATLSGTHSRTVLGFPPTGKRVTWRTIDIWRIENGKFAEHWDIVDLAALQKQLRGE